MMPKPQNEAPNRPSWRSRPGTSTCQELPDEDSGRSVSSGPKKSRYSSGISTPNSIWSLERSVWRAYRPKTSAVSERNGDKEGS